jgi:hypothetical protein
MPEVPGMEDPIQKDRIEALEKFFAEKLSSLDHVALVLSHIVNSEEEVDQWWNGRMARRFIRDVFLNYVVLSRKHLLLNMPQPRARPDQNKSPSPPPGGKMTRIGRCAFKIASSQSHLVGLWSELKACKSDRRTNSTAEISSFD